MTRIERTNNNSAALIIMISRLEKLKQERVVEITSDRKGVTIRPKREDEKTDFIIDIEALKKMFLPFVRAPRPLLLAGEAEDYVRNLSFACLYYAEESEKLGAYDQFALFHSIHFSEVSSEQYERVLLEQLCGLFGVPLEAISPFLECRSAENLSLQPKKANEVFSKVRTKASKGEAVITFDSASIEHATSIDALFSIKDLLFARGIDVSAIPDHEWFGLQPNETASYHFTSKLGHRIEVSFRYGYLKVVIAKAC